MSIERRTLKELRAADDDGLTLVGYAALFNSQSKDLGGFVETIAPGAFTRALAEKQDVKCLFNHDANFVLGRSTAGTLQLVQDGRGLKFTCQLDESQQFHRDLHASILRGDIDECSFAFACDDKGQQWENRSAADGSKYVLRTLKDVNLFDVSAVTFPAYNTTSVAARDAVTPEIREALQNILRGPQGDHITVVDTVVDAERQRELLRTVGLF